MIEIRFKVFVLGIFFLVTLSGVAQTKKLSDPEGSFVAMMVQDIDVSITWYQDVLGFELINRVDVPERGFKQSNLKRGTIDLELIELKTAISIEEALLKNPEASRLQGVFKIGFYLSDFDEWLLHLENTKVDFVGSVVTDQVTFKRMVIIKDPDGNNIQFFER